MKTTVGNLANIKGDTSEEDCSENDDNGDKQCDNPSKPNG